MANITAKDFVKTQKKRIKKQMEEIPEVTPKMKDWFCRKPYYMTLGKEGADIACEKKKEK